MRSLLSAILVDPGERGDFEIKTALYRQGLVETQFYTLLESGIGGERSRRWLYTLCKRQCLHV